MLIAEAIAEIEREGGYVVQSIRPRIHFPAAATVSEQARKAIEFLVSEWEFDVAYEDVDDDCEDE